jgi:hypothetical protein
MEQNTDDNKWRIANSSFRVVSPYGVGQFKFEGEFPLTNTVKGDRQFSYQVSIRRK